MLRIFLMLTDAQDWKAAVRSAIGSEISLTQVIMQSEGVQMYAASPFVLRIEIQEHPGDST